MTHISLNKLVWSNCFSFGADNVINLSENSLSQIIAPNGYGKSSIPLILEEVLYNKNSKGTNKAEIPNRNLDAGYNIEVHFTSGADEFVVKVDRKSALKVSLSKNGLDISSHTAPNTFKDIADIIGLDFKNFQQLVYQSTKSSLEFLTATDTARKKFLIDLFDLSEYTKLFETFKKQVSDTTARVSKLETRIDTINSWISKNKVEVTEKLPIKELPAVPDFTDEITTLKSRISQIDSDNRKIKDNERKKKLLESTKIPDSSYLNKEEQNASSLQTELGSLKSQITSANAVLTKLKGLDDQCPTCLQSIDKGFYSSLTESNTNIVNNAKESIADIEAKISEINKHNNLIRAAKQEVTEYNRLKESVDHSLPTTESDFNDLNNQLNELNNQLAEARNQLSIIEKENSKSISFNSKIDIYQSQIEDHLNEISEVQKALNIEVELLRNLEVLKKAFSTNGLIAYKLENLVKDLETYTNEFLSDMSDGRFTIEFSISNDKLDVVITDEGKEISIKSVSSGEMARINTSTLLAIRKLMSSISKNTINVLFLDEVISVLDDVGREKLVEVLSNEHGLNCFLVSHGWEHPLVSKIQINKVNGISEIES